jgi:hypothetical protein
MARKTQSIVSATGGSPAGGETPHAINATIDRVLTIQRPVVLAHLRSIRRRHPQAGPQQLIRILELRYLATVTTGGAAVGVAAVIPGVGTGITLALSGLETAGFLEATALYAQSLSELHGIAVDDPERARALVLTMMLGREGSDLVRQLAGQVTGSPSDRRTYWGEIITTSLPVAVLGPVVDRLKGAFLRRFAVSGGSSILGRALPFGVGAVVGGAGNNIVGRRVVQNSRLAFGAAPLDFAPALDPRVRTVRVGRSSRIVGATLGRAKQLGGAATDGIAKAGRTAADGVVKVARRGQRG